MEGTKITLFCICGAGAEGEIGAQAGAIQKFKEVWYQVHAGLGHGDCDRETAARAHAKNIAEEKGTA